MYRISFTREASKTFLRLPRPTAGLIREKLAQIANDPFAEHPNATKLKERPGYRLRVGDWRVIYEIRKEVLLILVVKIGTRGEVYR